MKRLWLSLALLIWTVAPARAELVFFSSGRTLSVKSYTVDGDSLVLVLRGGGELVCQASIVERITPDEVPYPEPVVPPVAVPDATPARDPSPSWVPLKANPQFDPLIRKAAAAHGVDAELIRALIQVESAYQPRARSRKGALGLMQVMPQTGQQYGVGARKLYDPVANIEVGIKHLKSLLERFPLDLALAAYNAGQGAVERFQGVPPYPETRNYVARILALIGG